ncbi:hypothetical protein, conserved [Eimeria acervulina]|uniref:PPM-type phosphatase domain-containing protein n=1 Tax=Eimeria acervulina TaxID=5801 RepID=U6GFD3_EIMAC|nr:hypothetical protein, conserved [Eimeria acervulina]CDI78890.1 hypothetical protein, conserved [Eimeria acervulina]
MRICLSTSFIYGGSESLFFSSGSPCFPPTPPLSQGPTKRGHAALQGKGGGTQGFASNTSAQTSLRKRHSVDIMVPWGLSGGPAFHPGRFWVLWLLFILAIQALRVRTLEQDFHSVDNKPSGDHGDKLGGHQEQGGEQREAHQQQPDFEGQEDPEQEQKQGFELQEYQKDDLQVADAEEEQQQQQQELQYQKGVGQSFQLLEDMKGTDSESLATATVQLQGLLKSLERCRGVEKSQQGMVDSIQRALKTPQSPSPPTPSPGAAGSSGVQGPANHLKRKTMKLHLGFAETAAATVIGRRADDEDALLLSAPLPGRPSSFITGLFDGHGGHVVARKCSVLAPTFFGRMPDFSGNSFAEASFALDAALRSDPEIPIGPGSTGIIGILLAEDPAVPEFTLHVANIGDSRLLVLHTDGTFTPMSVDQKPNDPVEMARVQRAGGSVMRTAMGVWRIDGRLALSRSFGDFRMKGRTDILPSQQKVVALPHARTIKVKAGDILVFACDGVFEAQGMTWKFVASYVSAQLEASGFPYRRRLLRATGGNLEETVSRLISTAYLMGSGDNISAMIIRISPREFGEPAVSASEVDIMGVPSK